MPGMFWELRLVLLMHGKAYDYTLTNFHGKKHVKGVQKIVCTREVSFTVLALGYCARMSWCAWAAGEWHPSSDIENKFEFNDYFSLQ